MSQQTIDRAILEEIMLKNLNLIVMALADAAAYREELGEEPAADAYGRLADELEEWIYE
jgi:hypothetical protein